MLRFTHIFRRFFVTEKQTPQTFSLLECWLPVAGGEGSFITIYPRNAIPTWPVFHNGKRLREIWFSHCNRLLALLINRMEIAHMELLRLRDRGWFFWQNHFSFSDVWFTKKENDFTLWRAKPSLSPSCTQPRGKQLQSSYPKCYSTFTTVSAFQ